jgi:hypothetical protein
MNDFESEFKLSRGANRESDMARSLVALGTVAVLGTATLTTSNPAAAQPWLLPVVAGAFLGAAAASPYPYYNGYNGYGYNGYGYNGYGYNGYGYNGYGYNGYGYNGYYPAYYGGYGGPYYPGYGAGTTIVIVTPHY